MSWKGRLKEELQVAGQVFPCGTRMISFQPTTLKRGEAGSDVNLTYKLKVGFPFSPDEFLSEARKVTHPL